MQVIGMRRVISLAFALGIAGLSAAAGAESQPEDIIKYRQNVMKAIGGHMGAAGAIIQGKVGYKAHLSEHAKAIAAMTKDIPGLFPKDSDFGETNALESVWKKRADFEKAASNARAKAEAFAKAAAGNDPKAAGAAFKDLSETCKACHKDFRKEQK